MSDIQIAETPFPPTRRQGPLIRPLQENEVFMLAKAGMTIEQMAPYLGMKPMVLAQYFHNHPDIHDAYISGKLTLIARAGHVVGKKVDEGDLDAAKFVLRTKGGWSTVQNVHVRGGASGPSPAIDSHVSDLAAEHSALLDAPDPDAIDAEWQDVTPADAPAAQEPSAEELAALLA